MDMLWIEKDELLSYIKTYFSSDSPSPTDGGSTYTVEILRDNDPVVWHHSGHGRLEVIARPVEFFIVAQCYPVTQVVDCLVEEVCNNLSDLCRTQHLMVTALDPKAPVHHYITIRSPHSILRAPTGAILLTLTVSVFSETGGRRLLFS